LKVSNPWAPKGPSDDTPVGTIRPIPMGDIAGVDDLVDFERPGHGPRGRRGRSVGSRRRRIPIPVRVVLGLILLVFGYYAVNVIQVFATGRSDQARPVDAIVVMGAAQYDGRPSPQLAARLDHVVTLYRAGFAPVVVVTGGKQPADRFTEAEASRDYLVERGVPSDAILLESEGRTTYQSLEGVADLLEARGLVRVLVVTDPFHSLRSRMIAEDVGLLAYVSPTPGTVVRGGQEVRRTFLEAAGVAVGRIIGFDRL
jgi:uncharacterized SAM-binding protein YcdF (DUF218 family)